MKAIEIDTEMTLEEAKARLAEQVDLAADVNAAMGNDFQQITSFVKQAARGEYPDALFSEYSRAHGHRAPFRGDLWGDRFRIWEPDSPRAVARGSFTSTSETSTRITMRVSAEQSMMVMGTFFALGYLGVLIATGATVIDGEASLQEWLACLVFAIVPPAVGLSITRVVRREIECLERKLIEFFDPSGRSFLRVSSSARQE